MKPKHKLLLGCLLLVLCNLAVFFPVLSHEFINLDDHLYVTENQYVQKGLNLKSIQWAFTTIHAEFYHPVTWISLMADTTIFGTNARGYLTTNLLLHTFNSLLVFYIFLAVTGFYKRSLVMAILFALHPLHVETVAWISDRKDILCSFFFFVSIWFYASYHQQAKPLKYVLLVIAFTLALLSKPTAITLPCILLLLDIWPLERLPIKKDLKALKSGLLASLREKILLFIMAIAGGLMAIYAQKAGGGLGSLAVYPMDVRIGNAIISLASYILKTIWPLKLAIFYPYSVAPSYFLILSALVFLVIMTLIVINQSQERPYLFVGWFWFLIVLLPSIGFLKFGEFSMADRYTYISIMGLFIMAIWSCAELVAHFRIKSYVAMSGTIILLSSLAMLSSYQVKHWRNSQALYEHALEVTKDNYMAHYGLGHTLASQGHFGEAIKHFQKAAQLRPDKTRILLFLGRAWARNGNLQEAKVALEDCLAKKPDHHEARFTLGLVFALENNYEPAVRHVLTVAGEIQSPDPSRFELKNQGAQVLYEQALEMESNGNIEKALKTYQAVLNMQPDFFPVKERMSRLLLSTHDYEKALALLHIRAENEWLMKYIISGFDQWKMNWSRNF